MKSSLEPNDKGMLAELVAVRKLLAALLVQQGAGSDDIGALLGQKGSSVRNWLPVSRFGRKQEG